MVGPSRKRRAARHLVSDTGASVRAACRSVELSKSSYYYERKGGGFEARLLRRLRELCREHPRYGYRRMTALLRRECWYVNRKRIQRLMRSEGLKVVTKAKKRRRLGSSTSERKKAKRPNHVWSWDFLFDRTEDGRQLKFLVNVDEYTRQSLAIRVGRCHGSKEVIDELRGLIVRHGVPEHIRSDNGSEFIAADIQRWMAGSGIGTMYIQSGSPWENPYIESFNGKFRDECLNREMFMSIVEARVIAEDWRKEYNEERPHSSLGYTTPAEFARLSLPPVAPLPPAERVDMAQALT